MKKKKTTLVDEPDRGRGYSPPIISRQSAFRRKNLILFVFIFYFSILGCFLIEKKYSLRSFIINGGSSSAGEFGGGNNNNRIETSTTKIKANVTTTTFVFGVDEEVNKVAVVLPNSSTNTASAANASSSSSSSLNSNDIKQLQIENYRQGKGLMLNMHPVHHAGTTFCGTIGRNGINGDISPNFACLHDKEHRIPGYDKQKYLFGIKPPWTYDEMNMYLEKARQYFHMISWEFNSIDDIDTVVRPLKETNWEHPKLLSIVITRDPLSRLLAGSAMTKRKYTGYNTGYMLHERWWDYIAKDYNKNTDNFFLRMIGNYPRTINNEKENSNNNNNSVRNSVRNRDSIRNRNKKKNRNRNLSKTDRIGRLTKKDLIIIEKEMAIKKQNETFVSKSVKDMLQLYPSYITKSDYDFAVQQLNRYTIVLDIQCLNDGIIELSKLLGLNTTHIMSILTKKQQTHGTTYSTTNSDTNSNTNSTTTNTRNKGKHLTTRQRIGYDDVYQYLVEKNYWDIKLYEYSKNISLVRC